MKLAFLRLEYPLIVIILAMIFIITQVSEAQIGTVVSIGNITTAPGGQVTLPIVISNSSSVSATVMKLSYDPGIINVTNATMADFTSSFSFDGSNSTKGGVIISTFRRGTILKDNATIAEIILNAGRNYGESPLNLSIISMNDHDGNNVPATTLNGTFRIIAQTSAPDVTLTPEGTEKSSPGLEFVPAISALSIIFLFGKRKR